MAGDWIKFETCTFEKPEVIAIADDLGIPETQVVGCLLMVWSWFDQQTENGNARSVSKAFINRKVSVSGFAEAMLSTGWLTENGGEKGGLTMPNFDRHTSKSAKKRALTAQRVARHNANAKLTQAALPREEKRRVKPPKSPKGTSRAKSAKEGDDSKPPINGRSRTRIENTRGPDQLARVCMELGFGLPPPGMDFAAGKQWAIKHCKGN